MSRMRRASAVLASGLVAVLTLAACSDAPEVSYEPPPQAEQELPADVVQQMQAAVEHAIEATGASGAIVGVWAPWSGSWVTGIGTQRRGSDQPVTTDQPFRIADVTRIMTCDLLYELDAQGVVSKNDPVSRHVSGVPQLSDVSLLDLCNGTAGIGSFRSKVDAILLQNPERQWGPLELAIYGVAKPRTEIKTTYTDSDAGYMLLGIALERATRQDASTLLDQYVIGPLGLAETFLPGPGAAAPGENALPAYHLPPFEGGVLCDEPVDFTTMSSSIGYTNAGAVSTIEELGRYAQASAQQALPGNAGPARWGSPLPVSENAPLWRQATGGAHLVGPLIGQFGSLPGYAVAAFSDPASGFTVAVVLNSSAAGAAPAGFLAWELAAIASKAPAAAGFTDPGFALPFTAEDQHAAIAERAVTCVAAPEPEPEDDTEG